MTNKRILLVDDEKSLRQLVGNALAHAGYEVELAASGDEGLKAALKQEPDLILTDIMMPIMDGYEMVRKMREQEIHSYIIFLTARGGSADLIRGFDAEGDDYLVKPFQMPELLARIRAGLRLREAQDGLFVANQQLQAALEQRDDLISLIAHDLRNPIHVLNSYAQIIGSDTLPAETIRDVCLRRSEEMLRLINNVTEMGNAEKHRMNFRLSKLNLAMLLKEKLYIYEPIAGQKELQVQREIEEFLPVFCDARKAAEVLDALLLAAVQLSDPAGVIQITNQVKDEKIALNIQVAAQMSDSILGRMLQLVEGGRGWNDGLDASAHLGLMVASRIVRMLGGEFRLGRQDDGIFFGFDLLSAENDTLEDASTRITNNGGIILED